MFPLNELLFRENWIYLSVKSSPIFFMTSAEDNFTLLPDLSVWGRKQIRTLALRGAMMHDLPYRRTTITNNQLSIMSCCLLLSIHCTSGIDWIDSTKLSNDTSHIASFTGKESKRLHSEYSATTQSRSLGFVASHLTDKGRSKMQISPERLHAEPSCHSE